MDRLENYLNRGLDKVAGWLDAYSARVIADLLRSQRAAGESGAFGEIGVHHGKLFLVMMTAAAPDPGFAVDVFSDQHLNVDRSGAGDRARFVANLRQWAGSEAGIAIFQRSSLEIAARELIDAVGTCRMVSIDGGHTEECTLSDLRLAEAVLSDYGIAVLDDCFNEIFPDVATGVARYCLDDSTALRPFAISPNKVFLARPQHHQRILDRLRPLHAGRIRSNRMFGHEVAILGSPERTADVVYYAVSNPGKILRYVVSHPEKAVKLLSRLGGRRAAAPSAPGSVAAR